MVVMKNMFQKSLVVFSLVVGFSNSALAEASCPISNTQAQLIAVQLIQDTKQSHSDFSAIQDRIDAMVTLEDNLTDPACAEAAEEINGAARISSALIAQAQMKASL